jgi:hypothetical protein
LFCSRTIVSFQKHCFAQTPAARHYPPQGDNPNRIHVDYYSPASPNTAITTGGNVPGNVVEVSVQGIDLAWMMPLSGTIAGPFYASLPLTLNVRSSDILGGYPAGVSSITR